jgi:hypothetical protein
MADAPTEGPDSSAGPEPKPESTREIAEALRALKRELSTAVREGVVLAMIQVDRARIWARESAWTIGLLIVAAIAILVLLVFASIEFVAGVCGAFGALFESAWAGSLVGGFALIAVALGLLYFIKYRMGVAGREHLKKKYESEPPPT